MTFLNANKELLFSGLGGTILTILAGFLLRNKINPSDKITQKQKSGNHSSSVQIGKIQKGKFYD